MILSDTALCALCGRSLLVGLTRLMSIRKPPMDISKFPSQKRAIFRKIKEIKELRGDVPWYVAQATVPFDAEIVEKGHLWMETK